MSNFFIQTTRYFPTELFTNFFYSSKKHVHHEQNKGTAVLPILFCPEPKLNKNNPFPLIKHIFMCKTINLKEIITP